jgi:uncharacterized membrane-anchored protein
MKLRTRTVPVLPGVVGTARVDRRSSAAVRRARPGDVVVLDHVDLDRALAEALVDAGVAAVVNAASSISGRYPCLGPEVLARAGVVLVDEVGPEVFDRVKDGRAVRVDDGVLYVEDEPVASGRELGLAEVRELVAQAREGLATQLQGFTHNATEFLRREPDLVLHGQGLPELEVELAGRPVVVVARDFDWQGDLAAVRRFIKEQDPVLVAVDAGADVLLDAGLTPALVVVGQDGLVGASGGPAVTDRALTAGSEVLVHADSSGRLVGAERLERLGVRSQRIAAAGTTTDIALLVAHAEEAEVIVAVGAHPGLEEFLDRQRAGLASTFLTRLKVGSRLVDAKAVPALYSGRIPRWRLWLLLLVAVLALVAAVLTTPVGAEWSAEGRGQVEDVWAQRPGWVDDAASGVRRWVEELTT